jgi:hypothetical protein
MKGRRNGRKIFEIYYFKESASKEDDNYLNQVLL